MQLRIRGSSIFGAKPWALSLLLIDGAVSPVCCTGVKALPGLKAGVSRGKRTDFQPKGDTTPNTEPSDTSAGADTMPLNTNAHRSAEVNFRGEKPSNATHA